MDNTHNTTTEPFFFSHLIIYKDSFAHLEKLFIWLYFGLCIWKPTYKNDDPD